jgi:hypothetical protein
MTIVKCILLIQTFDFIFFDIFHLKLQLFIYSYRAYIKVIKFIDNCSIGMADKNFLIL